jgi:predicted ATPase
MINTNWYVITGGPCAGKTRVILHLESLGHHVVHEQARALIDIEMSKGRSAEETRKDEVRFQEKVLLMKVDIEDQMLPDKLIFLDRGIPDSIAYYKMSNQSLEPVIKVSQKRKYRGVFLLDQLPFENDYARLEDEKLAHTLHQLVHDSYKHLGYDVIRVPIGPVDKRVEFILSRVQKH